MVTVYGIKNCDTVKRALKALDGKAIAYRFHDFKIDGLTPGKAQQWIDALGLDAVLNRRGTTWRRLDETSREGVTADNAAALLASQPSLVKRPVIEYPGGVRIGFARTDETTILAELRGAS
jgi:Spx/MgsR family transcriptional regulator